MQLTKHTDLALRVLMYLAVHPNKLIKIKDIAKVYDVSQNHLVKVVHKLVLIGYVYSIRGRAGGVALAKSDKDIRVGTIVRKMENTIEVINCNQENCPLISSCLLKKALDVATNDFLESLNQQTIHDLVKNLTPASIDYKNKRTVRNTCLSSDLNKVLI